MPPDGGTRFSTDGPAAAAGARKPPPGAVPLVVLRPKIGWRIVLPPTAGFFLAVMAGWVDSDGAASVVWGWVCVLGFAVLAVAAWRQRIELHPGVIYRRDVFRWARPMRAVDIEEVTLHYEAGIRDYPHRVLNLTCYDHRRFMEVSFRWWARWWLVIRWLSTYCTRLEDGERVWAVRTDGKTRDRLEPHARPLPGVDDAPEDARL